MDTVTNRVKRGTTLLDCHIPDWPERIDLAELDLFSCSECMLGQLFGSYGSGLTALDIRTHGLDDTEAIRHGFEANAVSRAEDYEKLTAEWRSVIRVRRQQW